jgi:hypothetical protein
VIRLGELHALGRLVRELAAFLSFRQDSRYAQRFRGRTAQPQNDPGRTRPSLAVRARLQVWLSVSAPLQESATSALKDHELHQLLALVDALRDGGARERELAKREVCIRLKN